MRMHYVQTLHVLLPPAWRPGLVLVDESRPLEQLVLRQALHLGDILPVIHLVVKDIVHSAKGDLEAQFIPHTLAGAEALVPPSLHERHDPALLTVWQSLAAPAILVLRIGVAVGLCGLRGPPDGRPQCVLAWDSASPHKLARLPKGPRRWGAQ